MVSIVLGPGVQSLPVAVQSSRAQHGVGGDLEFLVSKEVDLGALLVVAVATGEGSSGDGSQVIVYFPRR